MGMPDIGEVMAANKISTERLRELLDFDPEAGAFTWLKGRRAGVRAGCTNARGYVSIKIGGVQYLAHRLAWQHVNGDVPPTGIDHIDGNPSNNAISNIRLATQSENKQNARKQSNNTSGFKGVTWRKRDCKWQANIKCQDKLLHLGVFTDIHEAAAAYAAKARELHGEFYRKPDNDNEPARRIA